MAELYEFFQIILIAIGHCDVVVVGDVVAWERMPRHDLQGGEPQGVNAIEIINQVSNSRIRRVSESLVEYREPDLNLIEIRRNSPFWGVTVSGNGVAGKGVWNLIEHLGEGGWDKIKVEGVHAQPRARH